MKEWQNSLCILRFWNENVKCVFVNPQQKISTDKSKQTSNLLEIRNLNESCFEMPESSFEHLLTYNFKFIDQLATKNMTQALDFLFGAAKKFS